MTTDDAIVEIMARAACREDGEDPDRNDGYEDAPVWMWEYYADEQRAALGALAGKDVQ